LNTEVQRDQLILAEVEWLEDEPEQPLQDEDADLVALLKALAEHPMVEALNMGTEATGQQSLANQLAYLLPFAEEDKIDLLQPTTRNGDWMRFRRCSMSCRANCSPELPL
jgi:Lon protease-like protein